MGWKNHCCTLVGTSALLKLEQFVSGLQYFVEPLVLWQWPVAACKYQWWFREGQSAKVVCTEHRLPQLASPLPPRARIVLQTPMSHRSSLSLHADGWSSPSASHAGMRGCRVGEKPQCRGATSQGGTCRGWLSESLGEHHVSKSSLCWVVRPGTGLVNTLS